VAALSVDLTGEFRLRPMPHDCTELTMSVDVPTKPQTTGGKSPMGSGKVGRGFGGDTHNPYKFRPTPKIAELLADDILAVVLRLHVKFARYEMIDALERAGFVASISSAPPLSLLEQDRFEVLLKEASGGTSEICTSPRRSSIDKLASRVFAFEHLQTGDYNSTPLSLEWTRFQGTVREPISYHRRLNSKDPSSPHWSRAVATVDAPAAAALACLWQLGAYAARAQHHSKNGVSLNSFSSLHDSSLDDSVSSLPSLRQQVAATAAGDRAFATRYTWREEKGGGYTVAFEPAEECGCSEAAEWATAAIEGDAAARKLVRASQRGFYRIEPRAPNVCIITAVVQMDFGGSLQKWEARKRIREALDEATLQVLKRFERNGQQVSPPASETERA